MSSVLMLNAFAQVGLASESEIAEQDLREKVALRSNTEKFLPKTVGQLREAGAQYDFFDRFRILFGILERDSSPETVAKALRFIQKCMWNGQAGRDFYDQLVELQQGKTDLPTLKAKWPKVFKQ